MITTVGKDSITLKRNLADIFPKEFSNRGLLNEFINYILNNFFEKSQEKLVGAYVGEVIPNIDGIDCYITEPTSERQLNQIIPILKCGESSEDKISFSNFVASLYGDGCKIYNQNKLLSSKYWSWCPPINVDMFINYNNYYWVNKDPNELTFKVITGSVNVEEDIIGKSSYEYFEVDDNGNKIEETSIKFYDGMRVVFLKDTSNLYNSIPYNVNLPKDGNGYLTLEPVICPLIVIGCKTNVVADIVDKKEYHLVDEEFNLDFNLINGMRILFLNDANEEYNNKPFFVAGVGDKITFIDDSYKNEEHNEQDYIIMERGSLDGNMWSSGNRWVHISALEKYNTHSIDASTMGRPLQHAHMPILCFNKNIELYDCGTFDRGYVLTTSPLRSNDISGLSRTEVSSILKIKLSDVTTGNSILLLGNKGSNPRQIYTFNISGNDDRVLLQPKENGQIINGELSDGSTHIGDSVQVMYGENAGKYLYYDGYNWKEGQTKQGLNTPIKFNLYDSNKILLNNTVEYPQSTFKGCVLFEYMEDTSGNVAKNEFIGKPLVKDDLDKNYYFNNNIESDVYYYTPLNGYKQEIGGYRFFRKIDTDEYLNDWYLSENTIQQYIKTQIVSNDLSKFDGNTYTIELKYKPSTSSVKQSLLIYKNGNFVQPATMMIEDDKEVPNPNIEGYSIDDKTLKLYKTDKNDTFIIQFITDDDITELDEDYMFEFPLSLTTNQLNQEFKAIAYNNCFDQMIDIIQNQKGLIGKANGNNNYSSLMPDLSVGTKIVQNESSIIRSMILNNYSSSSILNSILYAQHNYIKFKNKFMNLVNKMYISGSISEDNRDIYETRPYELDDKIKEILNTINLGKYGLKPFYNNGVLHLVENAYVPSTPSYLGIAPCYEPKIITFEEYTKDEKPTVIVGHDGSYTKTTGTVKDLMLLRFETLIYDSIQTSFKNKRNGINKLSFMPGKFRNNTYSRKEVIDTYSVNLDKWANSNNLDYSENISFDYSTENKSAWKTWNYTNTFTVDGEQLFGSYRAIYTYYYDTYRPNICPWEMLGFGDKPVWWDSTYGEAPYTSNNVNMWKDIENGKIVAGEDIGEYKELKRPGLFEKYLPVDEKGNLKSPLEIGIINTIPSIQNARARWKIGDMGDIEFAFMQTSEYRYAKEIVSYLLRPVEWVETNWDTMNKTVLFKDTPYEQTIDTSTNKRENVKNTIMHNELIDGKYVQKIGVQQWISDYLVSDNINVSDIASKIRNSDIVLGYRCAGYYKKDSLSIITDSYGELPNENIHLNLFKSYNNTILTYSGMIVEKSKKGYIIDGFDKSFPYFNIRKPELGGKFNIVEENNKNVKYYHQWSSKVIKLPYRTEFFDIQDVYNVIIGYGKYLEENENWYFSTLTPSGEISDFRLSALSFIRWATTQVGEKTIGNILLLNPGSIGLGNYNTGMVDDMNNKIHGISPVLDIYGNPMKKEDVSLFRRSFNTYIQPNDKNISLVKFRTYNLEHLLTLDNVTIFDDVLYNPLYSTTLNRFKISGVKVKNWYGDMYAPGYLLQDDGAIPNFDKNANDLQYIFDVDDVHCNGKYADYSKGMIGYSDTKTFKELFLNDKSMFDFYKGSIAEKGTKSFLKKINRSKNISSAGNNIDLFEKWGFRVGEFGHTKDNSINEFLLDVNKMDQNPQIITFENSTNYYFDKETEYSIGDVVIYNNYEYKCLKQGIIGEFDETLWEKGRYVGNYIIFEDDKNWLKKPRNFVSNVFKYSEDFITNPIGGFPMINDCDFIVFNEDEFKKQSESMEIGETIWIAKLQNGDWDVRKKTGINKFVSMRYDTLKKAYEQKDDDYVYHFTDNFKDYYTLKPSLETEEDMLTPIYDDIDCNNEVMTWADVTHPIYTGWVGEYPNGINHKIKLYNTVFTTTTLEDEINNGTPIKEYKNENTILSYSNLLLNMTQFGKEEYIYKYLFTLRLDTKVNDCSITINGTEYKNPKNKSVSVVVCGGDVIDWKTYVYGCGTKSGREIVGTDGTPQNLNLTVTMSYKDGYVVGESSIPMTDADLGFYYPGTYEVKLVGAGGGASGGSWKKNHKHWGNGGASGAYLHGKIFLTEDDVKDRYKISIGAGGAGGADGKHAGHDGKHGGDTLIYRDTSNGRKILVNAQGGAGSSGARAEHKTDSNGRKLGYGGNIIINVPMVDKLSEEKTEFLYLNDSSAGKNGGLGRYDGKRGESVYPGGTFGRGGNGRYKYSGYAGVGGYAQIKFVKGQVNDKVSKTTVQPLAREILSTDSMEYSAYYQPYIVPHTNGKETFFYAYDVLFDDGLRPNAETVNSNTQFYLNRSKAVNAYHKSNVSKGALWADGSNKKYIVGDTITVNINGNNKYYICEKDNIATGVFTPTETTSSGDVIVYWKEYAPTYYYKITYNNGKNDDAMQPTYDNYELYEDKNCNIRAEKLNGDYLMTTADLDFSRNYSVGNSYTLVDTFATYEQIKPQYLNEPSWGLMNQVGNYNITSGGIRYTVKMDKSSIDKMMDENNLNDNLTLYSDDICSKEVKYVLSTIKDDAITYSENIADYSYISNTTFDNMSICYELKDGDTLLYTNKKVGEIVSTDIVYSDKDLTVDAGTYGDYIPTWDKLYNYKPNSYTNVLKYVDITNTEIKDEDGNTFDLFYKSNDGEFVLYSIIGEIINVQNVDGVLYGELDYNTSTTDESSKIKLYTFDYKTIEVLNDENELPTGKNGDVLKVIEDNTKGSKVSYYIYETNWKYVRHITDKKELFKQVTTPLFVKLINTSSTYFITNDYTNDLITQTPTLMSGEVVSDIILYYNNQLVGKSILSSEILKSTNKTAKINIMFNNVELDAMFNALKRVDTLIRNEFMTYEDACEKALDEFNKDGHYLNKDEFIECCSTYKNQQGMGIDYKKYDSHCNVHVAKQYEMNRNVDGSENYSEVYLYGDSYYYCHQIIDFTNGNSFLGAIKIGNLEEVTEYNKDITTPYDVDKIVNVISYKERGDYIYITRDSYATRNKFSENGISILNDNNNIAMIDGTYMRDGQSGWMKVEYINKNNIFDVITLERKHIATNHIKECNLVDNNSDATIIKVQVYDPILNIIPNNVLDEVNYISSIDPVNNYNDSGKWNEQKVGYLWWDTSKVRYIDYHQGDYEYRRKYWGKQLPGSEIAIMEWTKSIYKPTDDRKYISRQIYNYETDTLETYYYYWDKNPVTVPNVAFRKNSALVISSIINNPTDEGIVWIAPIDGNINSQNENTLIISNYNNVINGQDAVLQLVMDSDVDVLEHTEWALIKENTDSDIPEYLWTKMKDSLLGVKMLSDGRKVSVPDESLIGRQRLGISYRPRQTMFNNIYNARENFIDIVNDIFANRDVNNLSVDTSSDLVTIIDKPTMDYMDVATNKMEMMSWRDIGLIGQRVMVSHDETLNGIWSIYQIDSFENGEDGYKLVEYQKHNISKYIDYIDWYMYDDIKYLTPLYTLSTSSDAVRMVSSLMENQIVEYKSEDGDWEIWQLKDNKGVLEPTLVAQSNKLLQIKSEIYDYVNNNYDNTKPYITLYKEDENGELVIDTVLTEMQYMDNETQYLLEQLIDYFDK